MEAWERKSNRLVESKGPWTWRLHYQIRNGISELAGQTAKHVKQKKELETKAEGIRKDRRSLVWQEAGVKDEMTQILEYAQEANGVR